MNTQPHNYHQIDLEEAILQVNSDDFDSKFHVTENDEEAAIFLIHECSGKNIHDIEADIHHQIDPSYQ